MTSKRQYIQGTVSGVYTMAHNLLEKESNVWLVRKMKKNSFMIWLTLDAVSAQSELMLPLVATATC